MIQTPQNDNSLTAYGDFTKENLDELGFALEPAEPNPNRMISYLPNIPGPAYLTKLGLGIWRNPVDMLLVGALDESLHPHDRWRYMRIGDSDWHAINHHTLTLNKVENLRNDLNNELMAIQLGLDGSKSPQLHWRLRGFHANTLLGDLLLRDKRLSPVDLHDLAFHYETWVSRNPEFADMPRDLVWRMHGFGKAATIAQNLRGLRQRVPGLAADDAFMPADVSEMDIDSHFIDIAAQ